MDQIVLNQEMLSGRSNAQWLFRFDDMFAALEQLTALLREENALLAEYRISAIGELQEKKSQLGWLIELQKEYLKKHPELLRSLNAQMHEKIRERGEMLERALEENHHRLTSARLINQKIVQAVTAVVSDQAGTATGYNHSGERGLVIGRERKNAASITLNQAV